MFSSKPGEHFLGRNTPCLALDCQYTPTASDENLKPALLSQVEVLGKEKVLVEKPERNWRKLHRVHSTLCPPPGWYKLCLLPHHRQTGKRILFIHDCYAWVFTTFHSNYLTSTLTTGVPKARIYTSLLVIVKISGRHPKHIQPSSAS